MPASSLQGSRDTEPITLNMTPQPDPSGASGPESTRTPSYPAPGKYVNQPAGTSRLISAGQIVPVSE